MEQRNFSWLPVQSKTGQRVLSDFLDSQPVLFGQKAERIEQIARPEYFILFSTAGTEARVSGVALIILQRNSLIIAGGAYSKEDLRNRKGKVFGDLVHRAWGRYPQTTMAFIAPPQGDLLGGIAADRAIRETPVESWARRRMRQVREDLRQGISNRANARIA